MAITGYGLDSYQDIASVALGGYAGKVAPTFQQAVEYAERVDAKRVST